ncbi:embryogenesis-associated protein EMB8 isoform X2 [Hevea brasiliensis]|uniref:embryogenesis-associated protein EMB8 isoform X2 n=1 Tax=Hevea brasiliensis TaxID=3981 RepID=UPI0025E011D8|nr:embryogenesis-associated protein EMB8 isoform X2 [Hevea brasiliensis]
MDDFTVPSLDSSPVSPYELIFKALSLIPISHFLLGLLLILLLFLYNFLEIHFLQDLVTGFRGDPVLLTCSSSSELYQSVASKCRILHGRFSPTPWLSSPHLQTAFLSLFGNSPNFSYRRHIFHANDGGTIALDWLMSTDVEQGVCCNNDAVLRDDKAPIVIVIPGLTSDSASAYIKHLALTMARQGWNVVVCNHRGLGGMSITSDCFYNAGWTEDVRSIIDHIHREYPEAPLYAVGTSIGANILVKYLGEQGVTIPLTGAAAVCSPWDLLSRSVRDFDKHATRVLAKFETVDTYYRRSSCVNLVGNVSLPLLCVSALDDPVCTREAIPWDECRANENIILATTRHGGHLAYYEGITANNLWWVRAVDEFFHALQSSPLRNRRKKMEESNMTSVLESSIDQGPYVNVREDGMVTAIGNTKDNVAEDTPNEHGDHVKRDEENISERERRDNMTEETHSKTDLKQRLDQNLNDLIVPIRRHMGQLSRRSRISIWLLAYIAVVTTWPLVGSALLLFINRKFKNIIPGSLLRR